MFAFFLGPVMKGRGSSSQERSGHPRGRGGVCRAGVWCGVPGEEEGYNIPRLVGRCPGNRVGIYFCATPGVNED